ncbi:acetoin utilization protein AcuC [Brevibacterium sp. CS2]|uniref:acetoin utilization protein AcuC n=1 Tax=Brevibacterium sp. CS2 TaxID=2575923 RepID=UPI0010C77501|nr:acetoin utilization protein AcuC [Brevibacterium sp. CS2]QCP04026.1 acetoin utilization protein AcuC [Brevibacterium sp. CS2]
MSRRETDVFVIWDDSFTEYNFGPEHPMNPLRLDLTAKLATDFRLFDNARVHISGVPEVDEPTLLRLHSQEFVDAVKDAERSSSIDEATAQKYGVGTEDVPRFEKIHEASGRIFQGSVEAARAITGGNYERAVNFCGGMHHAMPGRAAGFCVYNDLAGAIDHFLAEGYERIAYLDLDAHHGDGVENFYWDDPRVLTISLHENGRFLFPGTGFANDIGGLSASASAVNVALPPRTDDADWLRAIDSVVPAVLREFRPQVLISQHGCDGHRLDPLTHLRLSVDAMRRAAEWVRDLADDYAEGRWLATGGGGYALVDVVPRAWVNLVAIAAGADIVPSTALPERWKDYVTAIAGVTPPEVMTDGHDGMFASWAGGFDPESDLDRTVMSTRKNIFPFYGLDAYYD